LPTDGETLRFDKNINIHDILPTFNNVDYDEFTIWFGPNQIMVQLYKIINGKYVKINQQNYKISKQAYKDIFVKSVYYDDNFYNTYV
jgi:hypothetical protein